jgi:hypothetical protein
MFFRKREPTELKPCPFCGGRAHLRETFGKLAFVNLIRSSRRAFVELS